MEKLQSVERQSRPASRFPISDTKKIDSEITALVERKTYSRLRSDIPRRAETRERLMVGKKGEAIARQWRTVEDASTEGNNAKAEEEERKGALRGGKERVSAEIRQPA